MQQSEPRRVTFSSTTGAVLAMAGVAIGLGNIWRFPYTMGESGGAAFLIVYVVIIVAFGIPALMAELALGRHTRRAPIGALQSASHVVRLCVDRVEALLNSYGVAGS